MKMFKIPLYTKKGEIVAYANIVNGEYLNTTFVSEIITKYIDELKKEHKNELVVNDKKPSKQDIGKYIIAYLNEKAGKRFRPVASNLKFINARLKEGYTIDDLKYVIDIKVADNKAGKFEDLYLRPETLFNATKFQGYINQKTNIKEPKDRW